MDGYIKRRTENGREREWMNGWMNMDGYIKKIGDGWMDGWMDKYLPSPRSAELTSVHFSESNKSIRVSIFDLN